MDIAAEVLRGNRLALSRAITAIENERESATDIMKALYPHTGHAYVLGITGPPGAGKSTMTDKIAKEYRKRGKTVGIIAVDPTSPFSRRHLGRPHPYERPDARRGRIYPQYGNARQPWRAFAQDC